MSRLAGTTAAVAALAIAASACSGGGAPAADPLSPSMDLSGPSVPDGGPVDGSSVASPTPTSHPTLNSGVVVPAPDAVGPLDALIESRTGSTLEEIREFLDGEIDDRILECAAARGVVVTDEELPEGPSEMGQIAFGGVVRSMREQYSGLLAGEGPVRSADDQAVFDECLISSTAEPDPLLSFVGWLDQRMVDANARMESDPRVLQARESALQCLADAGYPGTDSGQLIGTFADRTHAVLSEFRSGAMTAAAANDSLDALEREEDQVADAVGPCISAQLAVEQDVRFEVEQQVIDDDGEAIIERLDGLANELDARSMEQG